MDDSDQDFVNLCSKLLKRNRKKTVDPRVAGENKKKKHNKDVVSTEPQSCSAFGGTQTDGANGGLPEPCGTRAKDRVLHKMQNFRRVSPQRMLCGDMERHDQIHQESQRPVVPEPVDSDEALAIRLQQELDGEVRPADLEDEGLFFCQLCSKDISHMTSEGRTQHINRCLDEREELTAPPPPPGVIECPICGKRFKSQKNRASHLKRCSSEMGVPPAVLIQALQRQAEETQSNSTANPQTTGQKRKGSKSNMPAKKKKVGDEDTMLDMALSLSLLEQEKKKVLQEATAPNSSKSPALKWKPNAGKGHTKKKKGGLPHPPPLLLVQDPGAALAQIQERVSALLLSKCAPSPPTPSTHRTSCLSGWSGAAPLWQKSALLPVFCPTDFYTPELRDFIVPQESTTMTVPSATSGDKTPVQHLKIRTPVASILPSTSPVVRSCPAVSTPDTEQLLGCSQALRDLVELAEDGLTLTQYGCSTKELTKDQQTGTNSTSNLHSSGFVVEEEQVDNGVSGFLPEILDDNHKGPLTTMSERKEEEGRRQSLLLSRLSLDLGAMLNNPQLSDVQLQVDSGEVYFAHSFMVYVRCPLLAEMIHESGFGVQEEGTPAAQRVLLNDVPGQAVFALLQYLYTAHCSFPASLQPYILELASRFDLKDLMEFCQLQEEGVSQSEERERPGAQTDEAFIELLHSMWNDDDSEHNGRERASFENSKEMDDQPGMGEIQEEELAEIYEFAATQKQREEVDKHDVDASLDRSYDRLFSESLCEMEEKDLSELPERESLSQVHLSARPLSSERSARTLLQSSASVIDKLSPSPPPTAQNMPFPGVSPGLSPNLSPAVLSGRPSHTSPQRTEPELVVLSDSSDDVNIDLTQSSSSPSPRTLTSFTNIKEQNAPYSNDVNAEKMQPADAEVSLVDCSAEISWLIPSTPVQTQKSVTRSSQTKSSICRTRLFPKDDDAIPKSFSSSGRKSSSDLTSDTKLDSSGFAVPQSPSKYSHLGSLSSSCQVLSEQDKPLPIPIPAYSSTPVQSGTFKLPPSSPFSAENVVSTQTNTDRTSPSPEKAEISSFHLSPLSFSSHSKTDSKSNDKDGLWETNGTRNDNASLAKNDEDSLWGGGESSFRHSFMDEPPMAFNDSWGLDVCAENPCFSLKLDNSEGSVQQQDSPENIKTTGSTTRPPMGPDGQCEARTSNFESPTRTSTAISPPPEVEAPQVSNSLMDSKFWDSWEEKDEEKDKTPPLSARLKPSGQYKTPISNFRERQVLVPVTPMPHYSDMDTPELKTKLNKFGVRALPKRQMVLKLKEIHQYTHQLVSSDSEEEAPSAGQTARTKAPVSAVVKSTCAMEKFKKPTTSTSPMKSAQDNEPLSASQGSNTSSTAESDRSNPELVQLSDGDSDSDGGISASQSASRLEDRLKAVRMFILSDSSLYNQILQYQPLVLSQLQQQLKAAGIRLGVTKLADYLDSQCVTFTTAKPGHAPSRRRIKKTKTTGESRVRPKKFISASH